ncbi:hypothetical protein I4F81_006922 [Pyropia yezoensis]|uniref:Uncharacterized protein n=1 Tax=Pyropia yezoensis TaxID=2788 RepID=A0ACC3C2L6_PYRYE|nr:hypothetical protein I4F81_006922 [Neopyropia yezoensis]
MDWVGRMRPPPPRRRETGSVVKAAAAAAVVVAASAAGARAAVVVSQSPSWAAAGSRWLARLSGGGGGGMSVAAPPAVVGLPGVAARDDVTAGALAVSVRPKCACAAPESVGDALAGGPIYRLKVTGKVTVGDGGAYSDYFNADVYYGYNGGCGRSRLVIKTPSQSADCALSPGLSTGTEYILQARTTGGSSPLPGVASGVPIVTAISCGYVKTAGSLDVYEQSALAKVSCDGSGGGYSVITPTPKPEPIGGGGQCGWSVTNAPCAEGFTCTDEKDGRCQRTVGPASKCFPSAGIVCGESDGAVFTCTNERCERRVGPNAQCNPDGGVLCAAPDGQSLACTGGV